MPVIEDSRLARRAGRTKRHCGRVSLSTKPHIAQMFVTPTDRRPSTRIEPSNGASTWFAQASPRPAKRIAAGGRHRRSTFTSASLSCRTDDLQRHADAPAGAASFFPDLVDERFKSAIALGRTPASAPTRCRPGVWPNRSAISRTTARSIRCAATPTGWPPASACSNRRQVRRRHGQAPADHRTGTKRLRGLRQRLGTSLPDRPQNSPTPSCMMIPEAWEKHESMAGGEERTTTVTTAA